MAKPTIKKTVAPVIVAKKSRNRETVLVKVTASKLQSLIGDQPIGVSRKELRALLTKATACDVLAKAGL